MEWRTQFEICLWIYNFWAKGMNYFNVFVNSSTAKPHFKTTLDMRPPQN